MIGLYRELARLNASAMRVEEQLEKIKHKIATTDEDAGLFEEKFGLISESLRLIKERRGLVIGWLNARPYWYDVVEHFDTEPGWSQRRAKQYEWPAEDAVIVELKVAAE